MVPLEKLLDAWRADPGVEPTVQLCAMLTRACLKPGARDAIPGAFIITFGTEALLKHARAPEVHIAIATLYHASGELKQAARLLELAKKSAPGDPRVRDLKLKIHGDRGTKELVSDMAATAPTVPKISDMATTARKIAPLEPETFDAPTSPADPATEPEGPTKTVEVPQRLQRKATLEGVAPPELAALRRQLQKIDEESSDGPATITNDEVVTRQTDVSALGLQEKHPRRQRTLMGGASTPGDPLAVPDARPSEDPKTTTRVAPPPITAPKEVPRIVRPVASIPAAKPSGSTQTNVVKAPAARRGVGTSDPLMKAALEKRALQRPTEKAESAPPPAEHDVPTRVGRISSVPAPVPPADADDNDDLPTRARSVPPMALLRAPSVAPISRPPPPARLPSTAPRAPDEQSLSEADLEVIDQALRPPKASPFVRQTAPLARPTGPPATPQFAIDEPGPSTFSKALTNVWPNGQGGSQHPAPSAPGADESVDTHLRPLAPLHMSVKPVVPVVASPPVAEADEGPGTHVMGPAEAHAAARVDPRPVTSVTPPPVHAPLGFNPSPAPVAPSFGPPPVFGAAKAAQPAFGALPAFGPPPGFGPPPSQPPFAGADAGALPAMRPPPFMAASMYPAQLPPASVHPASMHPGSMHPASMHPVALQPPHLIELVRPDKKRGAFLYLSIGFAALMVMALAGYSGYLWLDRSRARDAQREGGLEAAETAILAGTPADLTKADAILSTTRDVKADELARVRLHAKIARALDVSGKDEAIGPAIDAARANGLSDADLAAGDLALAVVQGDDAKIDAVTKTETDAMRANAYYELSLGAALERRGDPAAIERYDLAAKDEPRFTSPKVRALRVAILEDKLDDADRRMAALQDSPNKTNLEALLSVAKRIDGATDAAGMPSSLPTTAEVLRPLDTTYAATALAGAERGSDTSAITKQGLDDADVPGVALLFGRISESRGEPLTALDAVKRALALSPEYRPAVVLMARAAVDLGKLDVLKDGIANLDEAASRAPRALLAYERGDLAEVATILAKLGASDDDRFLVEAERDRLAGQAPLPSDTIKKLEAAPPIGGLIAMDALLDAGDLGAARELAKTWTDASVHPLRARRYARLSRYEGKLEDASTAIQAAAPGPSTSIEQALIRADIPPQRALARKVLRDKPADLAPDVARMLEAYVVARDDDEEGASDILSKVGIPPKAAALPDRVVAALAFGAAHEKHGAALAKALYASFPANPDVKRAAEALKVTKGAKER